VKKGPISREFIASICCSFIKKKNQFSFRTFLELVVQLCIAIRDYERN